MRDHVAFEILRRELLADGVAQLRVQHLLEVVQSAREIRRRGLDEAAAEKHLGRGRVQQARGRLGIFRDSLLAGLGHRRGQVARGGRGRRAAVGEELGLVRRVERRRAIVIAGTLDERHAGRRLEDRVALGPEARGGHRARHVDGKRLRLDGARANWASSREAFQRRVDVTVAPRRLRVFMGAVDGERRGIERHEPVRVGGVTLLRARSGRFSFVRVASVVVSAWSSSTISVEPFCDQTQRPRARPEMLRDFCSDFGRRLLRDEPPKKTFRVLLLFDDDGRAFHLALALL